MENEESLKIHAQNHQTLQNLCVISSKSKRIVDFQIQEGNLKDRIIALDLKWRDEVPGGIIHVFDREGDGKDFFFTLSSLGIQLVTWEKNIDSEKVIMLITLFFQERSITCKKTVFNLLISSQ